MKIETIYEMLELSRPHVPEQPGASFLMEADTAKSMFTAFYRYDFVKQRVLPNCHVERSRRVAAYFQRKKKSGRVGIERYVTVSNLIQKHLNDHEQSRRLAALRFERYLRAFSLPRMRYVQLPDPDARWLSIMMDDDDAIAADPMLARMIAAIQDKATS